MVSRDRIWGAIAVTSLSFPLSCAFAGGLMLSHDARRSPSQEPWQAPFAFSLAIAGIVSALVCVKLLRIIVKGDPAGQSCKLVRIAALNPLAGGGAMVGTGIVNGTGGGAALMLLGLFFVGLGIGLVTTKELPDMPATATNPLPLERITSAQNSEDNGKP